MRVIGIALLVTTLLGFLPKAVFPPAIINVLSVAWVILFYSLICTAILKLIVKPNDELPEHLRLVKTMFPMYVVMAVMAAVVFFGAVALAFLIDYLLK